MDLSLSISTSGMIAQRRRLEVASQNLAHQFTLLDAEGNYAPYERREIVFEPNEQGGVRAAEVRISDAPLRMKFDPTHAFANADGYVVVPNVDPVVENLEAMVALRSYQANAQAAEIGKSMIQTAIELIA